MKIAGTQSEERRIFEMYFSFTAQSTIFKINSVSSLGLTCAAECPHSIVSTFRSTPASLILAIYPSLISDVTERSFRHLMYVQGVP